MPVQEWILTDSGWSNPWSPDLLRGRDFLVYGEYMPDATNTGPTRTLTEHVGDIETTADGQVIEGLDVYGQVVVKHSGVTVRDCHLRSKQPETGSGKTLPALQMWRGTPNVTRVLDCEIEAEAFPEVGSTEAVGGMDYIIERCNIHHAVDGIKGNYGNVEIYGCWIHDLPWYDYDPNQNDGSHNDGIQLIGSAGQTTGGFVIRGNRIECGDKGTSGVLCTQPEGTFVHSLTIDRNWFISVSVRADATATGLNLSQKNIPVAYGPTTVTNNRFTAWDGSQSPEGYGWRVDHDGLIHEQTFDAATISGNTWMDGITPAKITRVRV